MTDSPLRNVGHFKIYPYFYITEEIALKELRAYLLLSPKILGLASESFVHASSNTIRIMSMHSIGFCSLNAENCLLFCRLIKLVWQPRRVNETNLSDFSTR